MKLGEFERVTDTHVYFVKGPLSQWYKSNFHAPLCLEYNENFNAKRYAFENCEQYMMYNKAKLMGDEETAAKIFLTTNPKEIKQLGREVKNFNPELWDKHKLEIVTFGNFCKFFPSLELRNFLMETGTRTIVEAAWYDNVWGVGISQDNDDILDESKWKGENLLGNALMDVRDKFIRPYKGLSYPSK